MIPKYVSLLSVVILLFLCLGCAIEETPQSNPEQWMEQVVAALMSEDSGALKLLFSDVVKENDEIDGQLQHLFEFIDGEIESYDIVQGMNHLSTHTGIKESDVGCDIITTTGSYRIAIRICLINKNDPCSEGIQSLYAINANDISPDVGYWGGIVWNPGITIS